MMLNFTPLNMVNEYKVNSLIRIMETYLDSLPEDTEEIDVSDKGLTHLDVTRFKNLQILFCSYNQLTSLHFNENLQELYCSHNQLTSLHSKKLKDLYCSNNQLTSLYLNENLKELYCSGNHLTSLYLNENLEFLFCCNNDLYSLHLNANLKKFYYADNPIYEITKHNDKNISRKKIQILNNFRCLYYCLKFKKQFRDWLWVRIREPKIRTRYSHEYLVEHLQDNDLEEFLENW